MDKTNNWFHDLFINEAKPALKRHSGSGGSSGGGSGTDIPIIDDGKTRIYLMHLEEGRTDIDLRINQSIANGVLVDWGDGSAIETIDGTGNKTLSHHYASGEYVITIDAIDGCVLTLGDTYGNKLISGSPDENIYLHKVAKVLVGTKATAITKNFCSVCEGMDQLHLPPTITEIPEMAFYYCSGLKNITLPNGITSIGRYAFQYTSFTEIDIPDSVTSIGEGVFQYNRNLKKATLPKNITTLPQSLFSNCYCLQSIAIPETVTSISSNTFSGCVSLVRLSIPPSIKNIPSNAFSTCTGMTVYDFSRHTVVPTLASKSAFNGISSDCEIRVPSALYDEWIVATNWTNWASNIKAV